MAIVTAPLWHERAAGTIGKRIVMFHRKGQTIARAHVVPRDPQTPAQIAARQKFAYAQDRLSYLGWVEKNATHTSQNTLDLTAPWRRLADATNPDLAFNQVKFRAVFQALERSTTPHFVDYVITRTTTSLFFRLAPIVTSLPEVPEQGYQIYTGPAIDRLRLHSIALVTGLRFLIVSNLQKTSRDRFIRVGRHGARSGMYDLTETFPI